MKKFALKFGTVGLTSVLLLSSSIAYASDISKGSSLSNNSEVTQLSKATNVAYLDYDSASNDLKKLILEERTKIVYSKSWTIDGQVSIKNEDGTIEKLPEFKDLFPNWDLSDISATKDNMDKSDKARTLTLERAASFGDNVSIPLITATGQTGNKFYTFNASGTNVSSWASSLPGSRVNIGFTNEDTNKDAGWAANLAVNQKVTIQTIDGVRYSVRCSSYDKAGKGYLNVQ